MKQILAAAVMFVCAVPAGAQQLSFDDAIARLKVPDPAARMQALSLLEESGYPEAGGPIAALLTDPDERLQRAALYAELSIFLGTRIELRKHVAVIVEVRDTKPAARAFDSPWASLPIAPVPDEVVIGLLGPTRHPDPAFRLEGIYALGVLAQLDGRAPTPAYTQVADTLAERLGDPAPETRAAVARAAGRIFQRCPAPCDVQGLQRLGDALVHSMNDPDQRVRMGALDGLGAMRWERAVQSVTAAYEYYQKSSQGLVYLATLARIGHPTSAPVFKAALLHRDSSVRLVAGEGLARIGGAEAVAASAALAADKSATVGVAAAFALARSGQAAGVDRLIEAMNQAATRAQAQEYLVEVGRAAAAPAVAAAASGAVDTRVALLQVLGVVGGEGEVAAVEALQKDANPSVAAAAERATLRLKARAQ